MGYDVHITRRENWRDEEGQDISTAEWEAAVAKKGRRGSAGARRQYTGTAGRIENSQVGVFLACASSKGRALIDRRLYLPEQTWCPDAERRRKAGVPDDVVFATKPRLALQMIEQALDAGVSMCRGSRRREADQIRRPEPPRPKRRAGRPGTTSETVGHGK